MHQAADRRWFRNTVLAVGMAGALAVMAGCSSGTSSSAADPYVIGEPNRAAEAPATAAAAALPSAMADSGFAAAPNEAADSGSAAGSEAGGAAGGVIAPIIDGSKVIRTADLSIRLSVAPVQQTDDATADREANAAARATAVSEAATAARGIATGVGGFQSSADGGGSTITISMRVPADQYDAVLDRLGGLGEVTNRTESSQDVTAEVVDVNSRVESMTASVARVRALLAQATTIAEVISIEAELATREADLESLQQQQAFLTNQVSLSTVSMTLTAVTNDPTGTTEPVEEESGFVAGLNAGWAALLAFGSWIGGAVGAFLPFLPLFALAGLLAWWLIRRARRRRSAGGAVPPTGPTASEPTGPTASGEHRAAPGERPAAGVEQSASTSTGVGSG